MQNYAVDWKIYSNLSPVKSDVSKGLASQKQPYKQEDQ